MADLITLIYGSSARLPMTDDSLLDILKKAREKNGKLNVTGMLLYKGGNFLQILEGQPDVVYGLYAVIEKDPRHYMIRTFAKRSITERAFGQWEMGFVNLQKIDLSKIDGYSGYLEEPLNSERFTDFNFAHIFLTAFKEGMR